MDESFVHSLYREITGKLIEKGLTVTAMESCTAGMIASLLTDTEGSSAVFPGAFVTYSNRGKILCGVPEETVSGYGVYSKETAAAMAAACRKTYGTDIGIGVTGTFGNADPMNPDSVPGVVWFCIDFGDRVYTDQVTGITAPDRRSSKILAAEAVGKMLLGLLTDGRQ